MAKKIYSNLNTDEKIELINLLSSTTPAFYAGLIGKASSSKVNSLLSFYVPIPEEVEVKIWQDMKNIKQTSEKTNIPYDELVEDAGLQEKI